ncbi:hypothetical protein [Frateuria terrea]|uniref:Uncharacterized protein n=1 Tax=Frateuria terrea TaxID=529704 RepID=A0A1H6QPM7_9GAMM|nr:hypothetical protein [Frateuria terrea]SEI45579.1 hypothetical protein SAMN04487997_0756 [Frateuria terrea]SFP11367.1 hypothetical protein SAMN02927913_0671 [Frateuria terrea]
MSIDFTVLPQGLWKEVFRSSRENTPPSLSGAADTPSEIDKKLQVWEAFATFSDELGTKFISNAASLDEIASADRLYPQFFDEHTEAGQLQTYIDRARTDARRALESYATADLDTVGSSLATIAALMKEAYKKTTFNEDYGAVVSFIRRAALAATPDELTLPALNSLVSVLASLASNPAVKLSEAVDMTDTLREQGWRGDHEAVNALVKLLMESDDLMAEPEVKEELQSELFGRSD